MQHGRRAKTLFKIKHTEFFHPCVFPCHTSQFQKLTSAFLEQIFFEQNSCFTDFQCFGTSILLKMLDMVLQKLYRTTLIGILRRSLIYHIYFVIRL